MLSKGITKVLEEKVNGGALKSCADISLAINDEIHVSN